MQAGRNRHPSGVSQSQCYMKSRYSANFALTPKLRPVNQVVILSALLYLFDCSFHLGPCNAAAPATVDSHAPVATTLQPRIQPRSAISVDFNYLMPSAPVEGRPIAGVKRTGATFVPLNVELSSVSPKLVRPVPALRGELVPEQPISPVNPGGLNSCAAALTSLGTIDRWGASVSLERAMVAPPTSSPSGSAEPEIMAPLGSLR
jgi:hypothetical protein